jgi:hypothetical protein
MNMGEDLSSHSIMPVKGVAMDTEFIIRLDLMNQVFYENGWHFHVEIYKKANN